VYKLDSFVGFIGDEQLHAQECYEAHKHGDVQAPPTFVMHPLSVHLVLLVQLLRARCSSLQAIKCRRPH
jgi:hypothetical protein